MKTASFVAHLFFPRDSNNQKAKILHPSSLFLVISFLVFFQIAIEVLKPPVPQILGFKVNISPEEIVALTNEKRKDAGLVPLKLDSVLSQAALAKGLDMLNKGYWAHVSPDGVTPWKFFSDFGYKYRFAGENLARDFSDSTSAINAWFASPSHRENLMSSKYREIGVAVVEGSLRGAETTVIVQFFGSRGDSIVSPVAASDVKNQTSLMAIPKIEVSKKLSYLGLTKGISLIVISLILTVTVLDALVVRSKNIVRIGGRATAHIAFFTMVLIIILIAKAGSIL